MGAVTPGLKVTIHGEVAVQGSQVPRFRVEGFRGLGFRGLGFWGFGV